MAKICWRRLTEEVLHEAIDARTESLISLRELGPPDLVHLVKQPLRSGGKQASLERNAPSGPSGGILTIHSSTRPAYTTMSPALMLPRLPALRPTSTR